MDTHEYMATVNGWTIEKVSGRTKYGAFAFYVISKVHPRHGECRCKFWSYEVACEAARADW